MVTARKMALLLVVGVFCLGALSLTGHVTGEFWGHAYVFSKLNVDAEANVPTWYQSSMLLLCSVLAGATASRRSRARERFAMHWWGLAIIFAILSLDEGISLHENLIEPIRSATGASGYLSNAWIIPGAVVTVIVGLLYVRFLLHLPATVRSLMFVGAALFVGGALGMEAVDGRIREVYGPDTTPYHMATTLEEVAEMLGAVVFVWALMVQTEKEKDVPAEGSVRSTLCIMPL